VGEELPEENQVGIRKATNIRRSRAAVSSEQIKEYFANLACEIEGVPARDIFNCDKTCSRDDPTAVYAVFRKGVR
jgi:hypothetical protein